MILTNEQTKVIVPSDYYKCELLKQKWSYTLLGSEMSPLGNIIAFESPLQAGNLNLDNVLVFAAELPNTGAFGGTSFLRLYLAQLGSLLTQHLQQVCNIEHNNIFIDNKQASIALSSTKKDSFLFHIIFSVKSEEQLACLNLDDNLRNEFKKQAVEAFHFLVKSIFLETQRDDI